MDDDGFSSFLPDVVKADTNDEDPDEKAAAEKREKQFDENIANDKNLDGLDLDDEDEDSDSSDDEAKSSEDDSHHSSESLDEETIQEEDRSQNSAENTSALESYEPSVEPNVPNQFSSLINPEFPQPEEHSILTETDVSQDYVHHSTNLNVNRNTISNGHHSNFPDINESHNSNENESHLSNANESSMSNENEPVISDSNGLNISDANHSFASKVDQSESNVSEVHNSNSHTNDRRTAAFVSLENVSEHDSVAQNYNQLRSQTEVKGVIGSYPGTHNIEDTQSRRLADDSDAQEELYQEYCKLKILYNTRANEIEQLKSERERARDFYEENLKNLQLYKTTNEREKERLFSDLQDLKNRKSDLQHENNILQGKLKAVEIELSAERETKEKVEADLESCKVTILALEQQVHELHKSENAAHFKQQSERIVDELKRRHLKETRELKEEIDSLRKDLNSKTTESEKLASKVNHLQKKCEELQVEKNEVFNKLSAQLGDSQRNYQKLLETGTVSEAAKLKLQVEHLQELKSKLEKENMNLKDEIKALEDELETSEAVKSMSGIESDLAKSRKAQSQSDPDLKSKLQKSLKSMHSFRKQNKVLKEKLEELNQRVPFLEENARLFESRYKESESKVKDLQKTLEKVLPAGSIPVVEHNKEISIFQSDLAEHKRKLQDITGRLQVSSSNEKKLSEENKNLNNKIVEMIEAHATEKIEAVEKCRKECIEIHENAIRKLEEDLAPKYDKNLKILCAKYESKITELKKSVEILQKDCDDAKTECIKYFKENQSLRIKIDSISKPKEREEIEREVRLEFDKKFKEKVEEQCQKYKSYLDHQLKIHQKEWTEQKMKEVQKFVEETKQRLDEEFVKYKEKEKNNFEVQFKEEKEKITLVYGKKINDLKQQFEEEKKKLFDNLKGQFQLNWNNAMAEMQQKQKNQIEELESKIVTLENELKNFKGKNDDSVLKAEKERIHLEFQEEFNDLKQQHAREKDKLSSNLTESFQMKWKNEVRELKERHQCDIKNIKQKYEKHISVLEADIKIIKESLNQEIQLLKEEKKTWENERLDHIKNEHVLNERLSTAYDLEKKLVQKIRKYHGEFSSLRKKHQEKLNQLQEKINSLQSMNEGLKKSVTEKENELIKANEKFDQNILQIEESYQKRSSVKVSGCQTEEEVVPRSALQKIQDSFIECLKKIEADKNKFFLESKKRSAEQLERALNFYHDHLISKIFRDVLKDASSFGPNPYVLRMNRNVQSSASSSDNQISPNPVQPQFSSDVRINNSTPVDRLASGDMFRKPDFLSIYANNAKILQNERTTCDSAMRFEDVSFDFIPIKIHDSAYTSTKLPEYAMPSGLFNHQNIFNSYPDRDSPLSYNKR